MTAILRSETEIAETIIERLPRWMQTREPNSDLRRLINAFARELVLIERRIPELIATRWVDSTDSIGGKINNLARIGRLYGIQPIRYPEGLDRILSEKSATYIRGTDQETVDQYRARLLEHVDLHLEGTSTPLGLARLAASRLGLMVAGFSPWWQESSDHIAMLDMPPADRFVSYANLKGTEERRIVSDVTNLPRIRIVEFPAEEKTFSCNTTEKQDWETSNDGVVEVVGGVQIRANKRIVAPTLINHHTGRALRWEGVLQREQCLRLQLSHDGNSGLRAVLVKENGKEVQVALKTRSIGKFDDWFPMKNREKAVMAVTVGTGKKRWELASAVSSLFGEDSLYNDSAVYAGRRGVSADFGRYDLSLFTGGQGRTLPSVFTDKAVTPDAKITMTWPVHRAGRVRLELPRQACWPREARYDHRSARFDRMIFEDSCSLVKGRDTTMEDGEREIDPADLGIAVAVAAGVAIEVARSA
ncbi:hypothetical protein [Desulfosediminicola flagellatus]|uniref:hypothetical protein n=1 Tax=Desulfosediminicola flagellatus TaxID=2569541 RepID=UPI0010AD6E27|nr:hypothetical protein [Desulfosediminicola flagellatus]